MTAESAEQSGALPGRRALITGASSGIGAATAVELAFQGAVIAINHLKDPAGALDVLELVESNGSSGFEFDADVSDPCAVEAMFARVDEQWSGIDILVCNAGIDGERVKAWESDVDAWRQVLEVNLVGSFLCARQALQRMIPAKHGTIVFISSVHEVIPWSGHCAYTASKAAVSMMAKTLALEAAPFGVRVLAVAPGAIATAINEDARDTEPELEDMLAKIPMDRVGQPDDVATVVADLVSDRSSYLTGTTVFVDGGMTLYPSFAHGG